MVLLCFICLFFNNGINNSIAFCTSETTLTLSAIEIENLGYLKNHLINLKNFNFYKGICIENIKSDFFLDDLFTDSDFCDFREEFIVNEMQYNSLSVKELFIISEIFSDIQNQLSDNKFCLFGFEGFLSENNVLEINLQEFRAKKSFLSYPEFGALWNNNNNLFNDVDLNRFLFNCQVFDYPNVHFNCFRYHKHLIEYMKEYNELISMHNSLLQINPQILRNDYSLSNVFSENNPSLNSIRSIKESYNRFL